MPVIYLYGDIGVNEAVGVKGFTLQEVIEMVSKLGDFDELTVRIKSRGGLVQTGYDIFNYLRSLGKSITTIADGEVASIATVIFLAGSKRVMSKDSYLIIHNPWANPEGEADFLMEYAKSLKATENDLITFYSTQTGHTKEAIQPLMRDETKILAEQAVSLGFATEIESTTQTPLAFIAETKIKKNNMDEKEKQSLWKRFEKKLDDFFNKVSEGAVSLVLQDANGTEIDFPDLVEGDMPKVGDKANVDGKPAEGEIVMPDGDTFKFEGGELKEILEKQEEADDSALKTENESLKAENETLKAENAQLKESVNSVTQTVSELKKEFLNLKKNVGSSFNYNPDKKRADEPHEQNKSRQLFKDKK